MIFSTDQFILLIQAHDCETIYSTLNSNSTFLDLKGEDSDGLQWNFDLESNTMIFSGITSN